MTYSASTRPLFLLCAVMGFVEPNQEEKKWQCGIRTGCWRAVLTVCRESLVTMEIFMEPMRQKQPGRK